MAADEATADADDDGAGPPQADPLADLLFGLIAIIIPAVAITLPMIQLTASSRVLAPASVTETVRGPALLVQGRPAMTVWAGPDGVRVGEGGRLVPASGILDDEPMRSAFASARERGQPVLVMISAGGEESAFLLDTVLAAHGPPSITQVRLDPGCAFARDANLAARCMAGVLRRPAP